MSQTITLSDEGAALLKEQASSRRLSVDASVEMLATEPAQAAQIPSDRHKAQGAAARILEIQKRVKPDPEAWTIRDYIDHGRR